MEKFITEFKQVGICKVNIDKLIKVWTNKFMISQYQDEYTLVRYRNYTSPICTKFRISKEQAQQIILELRLPCIQSSIFKSGKSYRTRDFIMSEALRLEKIKEERSKELFIIDEAIREFRTALRN